MNLQHIGEGLDHTILCLNDNTISHEDTSFVFIFVTIFSFYSSTRENLRDLERSDISTTFRQTAVRRPVVITMHPVYGS